MTHVLINLIML